VYNGHHANPSVVSRACGVQHTVPIVRSLFGRTLGALSVLTLKPVVRLKNVAAFALSTSSCELVLGAIFGECCFAASDSLESGLSLHTRFTPQRISHPNPLPKPHQLNPQT
jgi:hypothetical protein